MSAALEALAKEAQANADNDNLPDRDRQLWWTIAADINHHLRATVRADTRTLR